MVDRSIALTEALRHRRATAFGVLRGQIAGVDTLASAG